MAITLVQTASQGNAATGTTCAATFGSNTTTGNLVLVFIQASDGSSVAQPTITSVVDSNGNTYKLAKSQADGNNAVGSALGFLYYSLNLQGGTTPTVTVTVATASAPQISIICREYSGLNPRGPFDIAASQGQLSVTAVDSTVSKSTDSVNELSVGLIAWAGITQTITGGSYGNVLNTRYTGAGTGASIVAADLILSSIGTQDYTATAGGAITPAVIVASFRAGATPSFKANSLRPHPFSPGLAR